MSQPLQALLSHRSPRKLVHVQAIAVLFTALYLRPDLAVESTVSDLKMVRRSYLGFSPLA